MKTRIAVISLICIVFFSCKKEQEIPPHITNIIQTHFYDTIINPYLIQNYLFDTGTYWIYKDSLTNIIDTCVVDSTVTAFQWYVQGPGHPGGIAYYSLFKYALNVKKSHFPCNYALYDTYIFMSKITTDNRIFSLIRVDSIGDFQLTAKDIFFTNYTIDTASYTNVYKIYYQNPSLYNFPEIPDSGYYYMKAGIGIIKSEYYKDGQKSVYELRDYHIN